MKEQVSRLVQGGQHAVRLYGPEISEAIDMASEAAVGLSPTSPVTQEQTSYAIWEKAYDRSRGSYDKQ